MKPTQDRIGYLHRLHFEYNSTYFGSRLLPITILIKRSKSVDGYYEYNATRRCAPIRDRLHKASITITEGCYDEEGLMEGTLLHEMVHQYQCEVLNAVPHHNKVFKAYCRFIERESGYKLR